MAEFDEEDSLDKHTIQERDIVILPSPEEPPAPRSCLSCLFGSAASAQQGLWKLGSGGFGTVYRAQLRGEAARRHANNASVLDVAVKILTDETQQDDRAQFLREIQLLREAGNEFIVKFLGVCKVKPDKLWLVTELLPLGDLYSELKRSGTGSYNLSYMWNNRGKDVALSVALGLAFLHEKGIVHFDLKSPNVLLVKATPGSLVHAKLADVGLSRHMASMYQANPNSGELRGTWGWMAPEVMETGIGSAMTISPKVDVFSFGIMLWEIGTHEQFSMRRPRRELRRGELPVAVQQLMRSCLDKDPCERPASAEIVTALMEIVRPGT